MENIYIYRFLITLGTDKIYVLRYHIPGYSIYIYISPLTIYYIYSTRCFYAC